MYKQIFDRDMVEKKDSEAEPLTDSSDQKRRAEESGHKSAVSFGILFDLLVIN